MHWHWLKFGFWIAKDMVLELTGKYFSYSDHISWEASFIWPMLHFYGALLSSYNGKLELPFFHFFNLLQLYYFIFNFKQNPPRNI